MEQARGEMVVGYEEQCVFALNVDAAVRAGKGEKWGKRPSLLQVRQELVHAARVARARVGAVLVRVCGVGLARCSRLLGRTRLLHHLARLLPHRALREHLLLVLSEQLLLLPVGVIAVHTDVKKKK